MAPSWSTGSSPPKATARREELGKALDDIWRVEGRTAPVRASWSSRTANAELVPSWALLLVSAVHHYLVDKKLRTCRPGGRDRRGAHRAPHGLPDRLRRSSDQPLPGLRHRGRPGGAAPSHRHVGPQGAPQSAPRSCQGRPQDDVEDGHTLASYTGPRSSKPSASAAQVVGRYFKGTVSQLQGSRRRG